MMRKQMMDTYIRSRMLPGVGWGIIMQEFKGGCYDEEDSAFDGDVFPFWG